LTSALKPEVKAWNVKPRQPYVRLAERPGPLAGQGVYAKPFERGKRGLDSRARGWPADPQYSAQDQWRRGPNPSENRFWARDRTPFAPKSKIRR
jgi:hypothetical protein